MISLRNLNKYYNKGKSNEIHVINNTSLEFPETGLVALTGPSGCGKTTLLNVIGGLDSFQSGEIIFDEKVIDKYRPLEWDMLRNEKVGYIFQNYNLVLSKTVYENIELALNMAGLYDKEKVEERINYVLESVGMYNYRKRNVKALSGGQQQRVAIARALAKDPEVVLADEPTGNLDANNTFEVMSIIKKISETRLVILVTHERGLVDFYADRIIELSDGKVIRDYDNAGGTSFDHVDDRNIYLKDLHSDDSEKESGIERYYDHEKDETLNVKLVEFKGNLYVKVLSKRKIKYLDETSEVKLIDDHYRKREVSDLEDYNFDLNQFTDIENTEKKSFLRWKDTFKSGFKRVFAKRKFVSKLLLLGYFIISALVVFQLASLGNLTSVDDKDFLTTPKDMLTLGPRVNISGSGLSNLLDSVEGVELSPYMSPVYLQIIFEDYYQGRASMNLGVYPVKESFYDDVTLSYGRMPENSNEVVIDEWIAEWALENKSFSDLKVTEMEELLGSTLNLDRYFSMEFEIVGIAQTESPIVIIEDDAIFSFYQNYYFGEVLAFGTVEDRITLTSGREIQAEDEIIVGENLGIEIGQEVEVFGMGFKEVVGTFVSNSNDKTIEYFYIVTNDAYYDAIVNNVHNDFYQYNYTGLLFYADDPEQAIEDFEAEGYDLYNSYEAAKATYEEVQLQQNASRLTQIAVIVVGIIVYIFFMMRSSMLNRIKEIGVYRAIGATKRDIYKIFFSEIISLTTVASLSGYLIMSYVLSAIQNQIQDFTDAFNLTFPLFIAGILGIYALNIIFGMLPIFTLLRKSPAEITAKYDI